jgi:hypothetical protein
MENTDIDNLIRKVLGYSSQRSGVSNGENTNNAPPMSNDFRTAMEKVYNAKYRAGAQSALGVAGLIAGRENNLMGENAAAERTGISSLVSMRGQDLLSEADKSKVNVLQGQLDLEKKKANTPYLGVMEEKPTTDWMSIYNKFLKM